MAWPAVPGVVVNPLADEACERVRRAARPGSAPAALRRIRRAPLAARQRHLGGDQLAAEGLGEDRLGELVGVGLGSSGVALDGGGETEEGADKLAPTFCGLACWGASRPEGFIRWRRREDGGVRRFTGRTAVA